MKRFATSVSIALTLGLATAAGAAGIGDAAAPAPAGVAPVQLAQAAAPADPAAIAAAVETATPLFRRNCSSCHGNAGEGGIGPRLAGSTKMESQTLIINQVLFGSEYMPPFADMLSNEEIAAIATFVRNSWGNAYPEVTAEAVAELRGPAR